MYNTFKKRNNLNIKILFILILINTLIYVNITFIVNIFTNYINVLKSFDISRIIIFNTFFYYLIFLEILNNKKSKLTLLIIFQIILNIFSIPEISYNLFKNLINKNILISIVDIDKPVYYLNNLILNENKRKDLYSKTISFNQIRKKISIYDIKKYRPYVDLLDSYKNKYEWLKDT